MEKYQFKDILWLISKRGVVIPIIENKKTIKNIIGMSKYAKLRDDDFNYNCIVKDVFSEDEFKCCLSYMQVILLDISNTLKIRVEKECIDIKEWLGLTDDRQIVRQAYNSLELTDKQVKIIKNELQKYFIKQANICENRTK